MSNAGVPRRIGVTFRPVSAFVTIEEGMTILDAARRAHIYLASPCGGRQNCGKCLVRVTGPVRASATLHAGPEEIARGRVLACQAVPLGNVLVDVPREAQAEPIPSDMALQIEQGDRWPFDPGPLPYTAEDPRPGQGPLVDRVSCILRPPGPGEAISDLDRIVGCLRRDQGLQDLSAGIQALRSMPAGLRDERNVFTATVEESGPRSAEILSIDPGIRSGMNFGAAVDVGTTTVALHLVDLDEGTTLGAGGVPNSQARFGTDVITRILHAGRPGGLRELQEAVAEDINHLLGAACREGGVRLDDVTCVQVAANPTMTQILLGVDPSNLRKAPFAATANAFPPVPAKELGIRIHPRGRVHAAPGVASWVGGDAVAGVLACGMAARDEVALLVDLGTNGEMVLGNRDWLACASCSVGPAFEGGGIACGCRACPGAIDAVDVGDAGETVRFRTIGGAAACGLCGSGLIDLLAGLFREGVVDRAGRLQANAAPSRVRVGPEGPEYVVAPGPGKGLYVSQPDLDNLVRSKAAVYAAASLLVRHMGLTFDQVSRFYIAGGFGTHLDAEKAVRVGLLPDQPREKFAWVGNSSLAGARMLLRHGAARAHAREVAGKMACVELSGDNAYHEEFMAALFLPHTDFSRFPSAARRPGGR